MNATRKSNREEIELLLPWYVNGTLDPESQARVEAALKADPALARSVALLEEDREAVLSLAEAETAPNSMERRFLAQLDAVTQRPGPRTARRGAGVLAGLGAWIEETIAAMSPRGLALAVGAAGLVLLLQAGVIASMLGSGARPGGFETASGEKVAGGPAVLVQFRSDLAMTDISALLEELDARIVDGPLPGGMFRLRFEQSGQGSGQELAMNLRGRTEYFQMVLPSE